jgi:D-xylose transport system ATP-binding protein
MSTSEDSTVGSGAQSPHSGDGTLLSLRKISKTFGPVRALTDVDLDVSAGQVTALIGDNGAGKSSLIKTVSGLWGPDGGHIIWEGREVSLHSPKDAESLGITTIYQDLALCENLDIVQNMFLGHELTSGIVMDEANMEIKARETLSELQVVTVRSIRQLVASLSGGQRQSVAVSKAVMSNAKLVIMDEPTAALGVAQTAQVLDLVRRLADQGLAVVLISHNMNDVLQVSDSIAALYLGQMAAQVRRSEVTHTQIVELITAGRSGDLGLTSAFAANGGNGAQI